MWLVVSSHQQAPINRRQAAAYPPSSLLTEAFSLNDTQSPASLVSLVKSLSRALEMIDRQKPETQVEPNGQDNIRESGTVRLEL